MGKASGAIRGEGMIAIVPFPCLFAGEEKVRPRETGLAQAHLANQYKIECDSAGFLILRGGEL